MRLVLVAGRFADGREWWFNVRKGFLMLTGICILLFVICVLAINDLGDGTVPHYWERLAYTAVLSACAGLSLMFAIAFATGG